MTRPPYGAGEEPLLSRDGDGGQASEDDEPEKGDPARKRAEALLSDVLYGIINAIVGIPTMISFAAIIFSVCP